MRVAPFVGVLVLAGLLGPAWAWAQCPSGYWVSLAPMSAPRQEVAVADVAGTLYVVGGLVGRGRLKRTTRLPTPGRRSIR